MFSKTSRIYSLTAVAGTVLIVLGTVAVRTLNNHPAISVDRQIATVATANPAYLAMQQDINALRVEVGRLQAEKSELLSRLEHVSTETGAALTALHAQVGELDRNQSLITRDVDSLSYQDQSPVGASASVDSRADLLQTMEEKQVQVDAQVQAQVGNMEQRLVDEDVDPQWANEAQTALDGVFGSGDVEGLDLISAECRTTLCKVELRINSTGSPEQAFRDLTYSIPWKGQGFMEVDDSGEIIMYLSREGYGLAQ